MIACVCPSRWANAARTVWRPFDSGNRSSCGQPTWATGLPSTNQMISFGGKQIQLPPALTRKQKKLDADYFADRVNRGLGGEKLKPYRLPSDSSVPKRKKQKPRKRAS